MSAKLELNLSDGLTMDELRELTGAALAQDIPLERLLLLAGREYVRTHGKAPPPSAPLMNPQPEMAA